MVLLGEISGVIGAVGTIITGAVYTVKWLKRKAERRAEDRVKAAEYQAKLDQMVATLEELKNRQAGER